MVVLSPGVVGVRIAAGSQRVMVVVVHSASMATMLLKRPKRSAMIPVAARPKQEPAFKRATSWYERAGVKAPVERAKDVRYVIGMKRAHSKRSQPDNSFSESIRLPMKNVPMVTSRNGT